MFCIFQARRGKGNNITIFFFTLSERNSVCLLTQSLVLPGWEAEVSWSWNVPIWGLELTDGSSSPKLSLKPYFWYFLPMSWEGEKKLCGFGGFLLFVFFSWFFFFFGEGTVTETFPNDIPPWTFILELPQPWQGRRIRGWARPASGKHGLRWRFILRKTDLPKSRVPGVTPLYIHQLLAVDEPDSLF